MSGSSLDGLDVVYATFDYNTQWEFSIQHASNYPLDEWVEILKNAPSQSISTLNQLSIQFGEFLAKQTAHFINEYNISNIDLVVSHGHTIYHYPDKGITCQIGDGQTMSELLKLPVLNNLRQKDMDNGGQGAPIVPIGDLLLFANYPFCLNIGGIANISYKKENGIIAFDIAMANQILNHYAQQLGKQYDNQGHLAKSGKISQSLLETLAELDFYQKSYPKSLDNAYKHVVLKKMESIKGLSVDTKLATYTEHLAIQIAQTINDLGKSLSNSQVLITGGGAFNSFLVERIQTHTKFKCIVPHQEIIEYKEALVMAFMGALYLRGEKNVLASVTGAKCNTRSGEFYDCRN